MKIRILHFYKTIVLMRTICLIAAIKLLVAGWVLFSVGVGADIGTLISYFIVGRNTANTVSGIIGLGCEIACIPTLIVGYTKKHRSVDIFNSSCANRKSVAYWSINASQNGLGIAYNL